MYTLFSWCSGCRADAEFELVADTMAPETRAAEYACQECGAAIVVPHVTAEWAFRQAMGSEISVVEPAS